MDNVYQMIETARGADAQAFFSVSLPAPGSRSSDDNGIRSPGTVFRGITDWRRRLYSPAIYGREK
jgi:hypothetical protein